jgi:hypothetical protein
VVDMTMAKESYIFYMKKIQHERNKRNPNKKKIDRWQQKVNECEYEMSKSEHDKAVKEIYG